MIFISQLVSIIIFHCFTLNKNDKVAIVWSNWAGKSSLMKILTWEMKNYDWSIDNVWNLSLWYLKQIYSDNENKLVREELREVFTEIVKMEAELDDLESKMASDSQNMNLIESYTILLEQFNKIWWNEYKNQIHQVDNWIWIMEHLDNK